MEIIQFKECSFIELPPAEMKCVNGGAPSKTSSFFYDALYSTTHVLVNGINAIRNTGIFTFQFWEEWGYSIL